VLHHGRLVVLDRQYVIASLPDHLFTEVTLAEQGITGHDFAFQGQDAQKFQSRFVFVGLGIDADLRDHRRHTRGIGGEQVDARNVIRSAAPQGFAVDGERIAQIGATPFQPGGQSVLIGCNIEASEDVGEGGFAGGGPVREAQSLGQRGSMVAGELSDGLQALHARKEGDGCEIEDGKQRVTSAPGLSDLW
jgi:hypothetical protein